MAIAERRIHLRLGAEHLIGVGGSKRQVLRRDLDRGDVLVQREQRHLLAGRHMEHVHALAGLRGEPHQALGRGERRLRVAPLAVAGRIALALELDALLQPRFVLGMKGGAPADRGKNTRQGFLVVDQEVAGRGAHEHFDAGGARLALESAEVIDIVASGADEEGEVAIHAAGRRRDLGGERRGIGGGRLGVRHLEHGGHPAQHRRAAARGQILLVLEAGLAEMHLAVDHAGQNVEAGGIDGLAGHALADRPDLGNAPIPYANIGSPLAGLIDDGAAFEHKIEGIGQWLLLRGTGPSHKCRRPW